MATAESKSVGKKTTRLVTVSVRRIPRKAKRTVLKLKRGSRVSDAMESFGETIDSVIVIDKKSGLVVPHDALLSEGDELDVLSVISGG